jgi:tetratricopeptide (TPR) repeat protein
MRLPIIALALLATALPAAADQDHTGHTHHAGDPTKLGKVSFRVSCTPAAQKQFNLAVAMLHSFWYEESEKAFAQLLESDPSCAMAAWGIAMSLYHPLWEPPKDVPRVLSLLERAKTIRTTTRREKDYLAAIALVYEDADRTPLELRAASWERAMERIYRTYPGDAEAAVFYGLSLQATAPPTDKTYAHQLRSGKILEKVLPRVPGHPGVAHYIIHAYDYPELAPRGLVAARAYARIAPAAPHAQHMPSHIFTRLGLWEESIASNLEVIKTSKEYATRIKMDAAYDEQLHGMDYLAYAYLQLGQDDKAGEVLDELARITKVYPDNFKTAYAFAAVPARHVLERRQWREAAALTVRPSKFPWTDAITHFARAYALARANQLGQARKSLDALAAIQKELATKNKFWADHVEVQRRAAAAWVAHAEGRDKEAVQLARAAADLEDSTEKHPVTPGAVVPARELLGELLLETREPALALAAFEAALKMAPNRLGALHGAARAAEAARDSKKARRYYRKVLAQAKRAHAARAEPAAARAYLDAHP